MEKNDIQQFTFFRNYYDLIKELKKNDRAKFLEAIVYYVFEDKNPEFKGLNQSIWQIIKVALDTSKNRSKNHKNTKSNKNQNGIKSKSNQNQNGISDTISISNSISNINNINKLNIYEYIEQILGRTMSPVEYELVSTWEDNELTRYAIKQTALNRVSSLKYTQAILNTYKAKGITTVMEIEKENKKRTKKANVPEWFDKKFEKEELTDEQKRMLEYITKDD